MLHDFTSDRRVPVTLRHRSARRHNPGRITWFIANAVKRFTEAKPHCPARGRGSRAYYARANKIRGYTDRVLEPCPLSELQSLRRQRARSWQRIDSSFHVESSLY